MFAFKRPFVCGMLLVAAGAGGSAFAQSYPDSRYSQSYPDSRYDPSYSRPQYTKRAERNHERAEKHDLKHHQQAERYQYVSGYALRAHQQEERHQLKHEQQYERRTGDSVHNRYDNR